MLSLRLYNLQVENGGSNFKRINHICALVTKIREADDRRAQRSASPDGNFYLEDIVETQKNQFKKLCVGLLGAQPFFIAMAVCIYARSLSLPEHTRKRPLTTRSAYRTSKT